MHACRSTLEDPTDEVVWARGDVTFAFITPMGGRHPNGQPRFWCRAGLRLAGIARRDRRLLRDYVIEARRASVRRSRPTSARPTSGQQT